MSEKDLSREELLGEIQRLRQELEDLKEEKADLEIILETNALYSDTVQADLLEKALEVLRESEKKLAQFLDAVPVGICVLDATGKFCYINHVAREILGQELTIGTVVSNIVEIFQVYVTGSDRLYPLEQMPIVRALNGEAVTIDDMELRQAEKIIPLEVWATPVFNEKNEVIYAIAAFQDITRRKQAEAEQLKFTQALFLLNQAYERFVPQQFLQFLNKSSIVDVQLGDQVQQEMSVLFADIRDFTALSESMTPQENFRFINSYLSCMEPAIAAHNGFIDKYIGDAIMALFSGGADDAVQAGISMIQRLEAYNQSRQQNQQPPIQIGIGINTGSLMLGTVGGHNRMESTVISDTVNVASRIENLTKDYQVSLLISHQTFLQLQDATQYDIRLIDKVKVRGKSETVSIFEVFNGDRPHIRIGKSVTKTTFEQALLFYNQAAYSKAAELFANCLQQNPWDKVSQIYLERCQSASIIGHKFGTGGMLA
jgi:adenylate cyclase